MSGLSTMGNAAEVASDSNDSTSPAGCSWAPPAH
jgi:hypothetical protein